MTAQEAIEILWQYDVNFEPHPAEEVMHAIDMAIEALRQPERKTGRWVKKVDDGVYWYECSECGDYPLKSAFGHDCYSEWCPHCGAKLEGVEECQR